MITHHYLALSEFPDPTGWLRVACRKMRRSAVAPRPTRRHLEALLQALFTDCIPCFADDEGTAFVIWAPAELMDLIAMFGALDDDAEDADPTEHNDGGEAPVMFGYRVYDDPDLEADDCDREEDDPSEDGDDEDDADREDDQCGSPVPIYADEHDQTSQIINGGA